MVQGVAIDRRYQCDGQETVQQLIVIRLEVSSIVELLLTWRVAAAPPPGWQTSDAELDLALALLS